MKTNFIGVFCIFSLCLLPQGLFAANVTILSDLSYINDEVKNLRQDVMEAILTVKSNRPVKHLPQLRFYMYTVKKNENFWTVLARTGLDMDSLISINGLSSPKDFAPGARVFIPNMRGTIVKSNTLEELGTFLRLINVHPRYVFKVNNISDLNKKYLFIPCGKISGIERSLFLGTGFMSPINRGKKTSGFGSRRSPFNFNHYEFHSGVDLACPNLTKVYAARSGRVVFSGYHGGYGNLVIVKHEFNYYTYYGHLSSWKVKPGDSVRVGQLIAYSGNTGRTTGPHLHFEVRKGEKPINPGLLLNR